MRISDWSSDVCSADLMVVQQSAEEQIASLDNHSVQIFAGEGWHPGVIGIVASRLKEKTGKPAFVIALDRETGLGKGSGRSITGVDLGAAVIAAKDAGLLVAGGGHAMAAGITIEPGHLRTFAEFLEQRLAAKVEAARTNRVLELDLSISPGGMVPDLVEVLDQAAP